MHKPGHKIMAWLFWFQYFSQVWQITQLMINTYRSQITCCWIKWPEPNPDLRTMQMFLFVCPISPNVLCFLFTNAHPIDESQTDTLKLATGSALYTESHTLINNLFHNFVQMAPASQPRSHFTVTPFSPTWLEDHSGLWTWFWTNDTFKSFQNVNHPCMCVWLFVQVWLLLTNVHSYCENLSSVEWVNQQRRKLHVNELKKPKTVINQQSRKITCEILLINNN